jgi:uncharacterized protein (TIGR02147 family)
METVFSASNYRSFLRHWIEEQSIHGLKSKIASAIGCQNSQLTLVLREEVHLTPDQAFELCDFMKLTDAESAYFLKLVEHDRSGSQRFRAKLKEQMRQLKAAQENLAIRFKDKGMERFEDAVIYYSSWHWSAIHVATMIPKLGTAASIAERLQLDESLVRACLEKLDSFGLVKKIGDRWKSTERFLHIGKHSPMSSIQHGNWRARAVLKSQNPENDGLHYTMVQCLSESDYQKIKDILFETIDQYRVIANPSPEEELICFNCDFFRI